MSLFIDRKYIGQISSRLKLFKQLKEDLFTFRCPVCGDSKRNKIKTRGYLYLRKNSFFFKCHNCNEGFTFSNFLKNLDTNLHQKYILERFANGENKNSNYKQPDPKSIFPDCKPKFASKLIKLPSIEDLPEKHFCRNYVEKIRMIPKEYLKLLYFASNFDDFVTEMVPGKHKNLGNTPKLIIPFFNAKKKLFAFQARSLVDASRYITIKLDENEPKIYGLDRVNPNKKVYVVEGPLDSLCIDNSIAAAGADLPTTFNPNNCVFIMDNEPRSPQILIKMNQIINKKYSICIWPASCRQFGKDINELLQSGVYGPGEIKRIIDNNTYQGLEAEIQIAKWSKL